MRCLCVDPGSKDSAIVEVVVTPGVIRPPWGILPTVAVDLPNEQVADWIGERIRSAKYADVEIRMAIEISPAIYVNTGEPKKGAPKPRNPRKPRPPVIAAGKDQLETERWGGKFQMAFQILHGDDPQIAEVFRQTAKAATIGNAAGTDAQVTASLVAAYGGPERAFGQKCPPCNGKGWIGKGRPECSSCGGSCWKYPPGPLTTDGKKWVGSHKYAALAVGFAMFKIGGDWWQATP